MKAAIKTAGRSILMAFSCFSRVPTPQYRWENENMRYMLAALPLVSVAIGLLLFLWLILCSLLQLGTALFAAGITLLPVLVTGGIHMDGFCDTVDALSSHAEPARKLEILKDPHPGAFAVVFTCAYFLAYFALASELPREGRTVIVLLCLHMLSRIAGAFSALTFPLAGSGGMLATCREAAGKRASLIALSAELLLCAVGLLLLRPIAGIAMLLIAAITTLCTRQMADTQFGGMRGDLVGYLITLSELTMLLGVVLVERGMAL